MSSSTKLLVVAYLSPPSGGVGAVRITKFIKYLKQIGWNITLITIKDEYYHQFNYEWLDEIKGVNIIRTEIRQKKLVGINEQGIYWYDSLKQTLKAELSIHQYDISLWTGGPFMHLCLAPWFKNKFGLKYILDLRDPWALNPYKRKTKLAFIRNLLFKYNENRVVRHAESILNVTEEASLLYSNYYKKIPKEKFITIPNGFDPQDFEELEQNKKNYFDIVYTGSFRHFRDPSAFFKAFKLLIDKKKLTASDIKFTWVGEVEEHIVKKIEENEVESYVRYIGFVPYNNAIQEVCNSNLCLIISGEHAFEPTTKIFDYLAMNKPILAVVKTEGFISRTLKDIKNAYVVDNTMESIYKQLEIAYEAIINKELDIDKNDESVQAFNRKKHVNKLDKILRATIDGSKR